MSEASACPGPPGPALPVGSLAPPVVEEKSSTLRTIATDHGAAIFARLPPDQRRALERLATCQTAALGVHQRSCESCDYESFVYNSCRHRICPRCLRFQAARWFDAREAELLPVPYFHLVFTIPQELRALALQNQKALYGLLFQASSRTLLQVALDPKRLGARLGFFGVLHTWGRDLRHHPHVHWVIPGGGLVEDEEAPEGARWIPNRSQDYLFPVQILAPLFRGKFLAGLRELYQNGDLDLSGRLEHLRRPQIFENLCRMLTKQGWHVHAEAPFAGPEKVLGYLARYTHRTAIGDERIVAYDGETVSFRYKDHADHGRQKVRTLPATEFLQRLLTHVLPSGFQRIRYYGFLANRYRRQQVALCRRLLGHSPRELLSTNPEEMPLSPPSADSETRACLRCPNCRGPLQVILGFRPHPSTVRPFGPGTRMAPTRTPT